MILTNYKKTFYDKLKDIQTQIRLWNCQGLSLFGKVTAIQSLLLPKMLYVFSVLTTPGEFIKQDKTTLFSQVSLGALGSIGLTRLNKIC